MRLSHLPLVGLLLVVPASCVCPSHLTPPAAAIASLRDFLPWFERDVTEAINGDPTLWKQNASRRDEARTMGTWGGTVIIDDQRSYR